MINQRKYNVFATLAIVQANILSLPELDMQLSRLLEDGRPIVVDYTVKLIEKCVLDEPPMASPNDFFNSLEVLQKLSTRGKLGEGYVLDLLGYCKKG